MAQDIKYERLPIKVVMPKQGTERKVPGGGGNTPLRPVDAAYRNSLSTQVNAIQAAIRTEVQGAGLTPIRVRLIKSGIAKSHRPDDIFKAADCPIIGVGGPGELFIKATADSLVRLTQVIQETSSKRSVKDLSCIETIELVTPLSRRKGKRPVDILKESPRKHDGFIAKVQLFNYDSDTQQQQAIIDLERVCEVHQIKLDSKGYSRGSFTYGAECQSSDAIEAISKVIGVRSVGSMPRIKMIRPQFHNHQPCENLPQIDSVNDVPTVVVVDSGVVSDHPALSQWIVGRETHVAPQYSNFEHGTFVAGLIAFGSVLNPELQGVDSNPCAIFDLAVLPNNDPEKGETDSLLENELLTILDLALQTHSNEYKVWNLSLGTDVPCSLDEFSTFAEQLDNLQEHYQVTFVIAAGNYESMPLLSYPRKGDQLQSGRISTPADSVLGVTVGSVSHVDHQALDTPLNHPSAFSRHGAGPSHIIKPDLVHYGGSCTTDGKRVTGVRSIGPLGTTENIGTSFAAPLVSRTLAQIYHKITPTPNPVLAKALLVHHARDPRTHLRVPDGDENFFGFGLPQSVPYCLECSPHTSTLVFSDVLRPGYYLEWDSFPYPNSLYRDGRYYGEVSMTVSLCTFTWIKMGQ
ncbi:MAG: S8 family peptidase [Ignavibacteria bacterium]|nr:S8 family peptidase [Ignavibacteria bacterium]